ncbi:hypothetical protein MMC11_005446 [Xylographa trunciseda]|nr:hypothetical protein [Xylographa trunciseda]
MDDIGEKLLAEARTYTYDAASGCHIPTIDWEVIRRYSDRRRKEREQEWLAEALEAGFSSVEEHLEAKTREDIERHKRWKTRMEEESGMPFDEWWANHPQREKTPVKLFPQCDCEGKQNHAAHPKVYQLTLTITLTDHPIPMFCAKSLVAQRTPDTPDLVALSQIKENQDIRGLKVIPNGKSKRMSEEELEQYWEIDSQEIKPEWPPWLKGDLVLRRIEQQGSKYDYTEKLKKMDEFMAGCDTPHSIFTEEMSIGRRSPSSTAATSSGKNSLHEAGKNSGTQDGQGNNSPPSVKQSSDIQPAPPIPKATHKTKRGRQSQLTRASRVNKNITKRKSQRANTNGGITRGTRSQNVTKFYELDANGTPKPHRVYG